MADKEAKSGRVEATRSLGPTGLGRRFVGVEVETGRVIKGTITDSKPATAKRALAKAETAAKPLAKPKPRKAAAKEKPKGGRPRKAVKDEPWIAAGLSKSAYYRKMKATAK